MKKKIFRGGTFFLLLSIYFFNTAYSADKPGEVRPAIPLGLDEKAFDVPSDNPMTPEKIELGRTLFFDKRLSQNNSISCANCHMPSLAFTDGQAVSSGIHHLQGGRSAPTAINRAFSKGQFWDGRAATLEEQSVGPFAASVEHGFVTYDEMLAKMNQIEGYKVSFKKVFGSDITMDGVGKAIASFQRTLLSGNSPFDRYEKAKDEKAIPDAAKRGLVLFRGKARCASCHTGFNFTDERFHNLGIGWDTATPDVGRYVVTKNQKEIGAFKTPTLREASRTAPYMHDGRFATLEEVVDFYNQGGTKNPFLDPLVMPLNLSKEEKRDLVAFLNTLAGEGWQQVKAPESFPE
jgi:cytochrome c peroxidase